MKTCVFASVRCILVATRDAVRQPKWLWRAALAGLMLAASTGASYAMTLYWSQFNDATPISGMYFQGWNGSSTAAGTAWSWASGPTYDAAGNAASGSLELQCNFSSTTNGGVFRKTFNGDITGYTDLEYDVLIDPASPLDTAGAACDLKVGYSDQGWSFHATDHPISGTGWQHVDIPLTSLGGTGTQPLQEIDIQEWDGNYTDGQINKIYIDNVKFTGPDPTNPNYVAFTFDNSTTCSESNVVAGISGGTDGVDCTGPGWYGEACTVTWDATKNSTIAIPYYTPAASSGAAHIVAAYDSANVNNGDVVGMAFDTNYFIVLGNYPSTGVPIIDGRHYSIIEWDVLWDTNLSTMSITNFNSMGDINGFPMGLMYAGGGQQEIAQTVMAIPDEASNGWVHMSAAIPPSTPNLSQLVGLWFKKWGSGINGAQNGTAAYWIDNVVFDVGCYCPLPPPTLRISKPVKGLNIVNNSGSGWDRESLVSFNTDFSWVDKTTPVTYSMNIASFPSAAYAGYDARIYLVPNNSATESAPDRTESDIALIAVHLSYTGVPTATIGCKTGGPNANGNLFDSTNPTFTSSQILGNWSFTFTQNTNILVTAPDNTTTNWTLPVLTTAILETRDWRWGVEVYFGGYNNGSANIGQRCVFASVGVDNGLSDSFTDDFLSEEAIQYYPDGPWFTIASDGSNPGIYLIPADTTTKYYLDWAVPANGYSLITNSDLQADGWYTNSILTAAAAQYGGHMHTEIDATNLPPEGPLFFQLIR